MPTYKIEALEKFVVRTTYTVAAENFKEAERMCKSGDVDYDTMKVEEGDEEWIRTVTYAPVTADYTTDVKKAEDIEPQPSPMQNGLHIITFFEPDDIRWVLEKQIFLPANGYPLSMFNTFTTKNVTGVLYICVNEDFPEEVWVTKSKNPNHLKTEYTRIFKYIDPPVEEGD